MNAALEAVGASESDLLLAVKSGVLRDDGEFRHPLLREVATPTAAQAGPIHDALAMAYESGYPERAVLHRLRGSVAISTADARSVIAELEAGPFDIAWARGVAARARGVLGEMECGSSRCRRGLRVDGCPAVDRAVARRLSNKEVAGELYISLKTVDAHLQQIYRKLDIRSRTQLAALCHAPISG